QQPDRMKKMHDLFLSEAKDNQVFPIGGGLWSIVWSPQSAPHNPATEFHYTQDVVGVPEFAGPKVGARSNTVTVTAEIGPKSEGVLYALGAFSGGLALWVKDGRLHYEYNLFEIERTHISGKSKLPKGEVTIVVDTVIKKPREAAEVSLSVNGTVVASGTVPRTAALAFTANDAFDVGTDSFSPVSQAYFDDAPYSYNGAIKSVYIKYN
ncbi:MAG: hypothetical protein AB7I04_12015, partial [Pseudomonadales bacterium]